MSEQCSARIYVPPSGRAAQCSRRAKVERDGAHYCTIHDPERIAKRVNERMAAAQAAFDHRVKERQRAVACVNACEGLADPSVVPELLAALEEAAERLAIHMQHTEDLVAHMRAVKAIARAKAR